VAGPDVRPNEETLYRLFGVNAELLIDHAWGWEPATIADVKAYTPQAKSMGQGQVLQRAYECDEARLVVREMADALSFDLVGKGLVCDQVVLSVGYDIGNLKDADRAAGYGGEVSVDHYGRSVPKHAHGTVHLGRFTSSSRAIIQAVLSVFDAKVDVRLLVRRINVAACNVLPEDAALRLEASVGEQMSLFDDAEALDATRADEAAARAREKRMQQAIVDLRSRFGKNAVLKGMDLKEGATTVQRNSQIGGHRA
jgi:DNA polymerase V